MIWLPVVGFLVGSLAVWLKGITVPSEYASYLSLAAIAGVDTILGGIRSGFEGRFKSDVFLSGFLVNTTMSALLAYFGDQIGSDLYLAAVVVLGSRIFLNLSLIRRYLLGRSRPERSTLETGTIVPLAPLPETVSPPVPAAASVSTSAPTRADAPLTSPVEAP